MIKTEPGYDVIQLPRFSLAKASDELERTQNPNDKPPVFPANFDIPSGTESLSEASRNPKKSRREERRKKTFQDRKATEMDISNLSTPVDTSPIQSTGYGTQNMSQRKENPSDVRETSHWTLEELKAKGYKVIEFKEYVNFHLSR